MRLKLIGKFLAYVGLYYVLSRLNVVVHELSHALVAYLSGVEILKIHISLIPYSTSYVIVERIPPDIYGPLFYLAGIIANLIQLIAFSFLSFKTRGILRRIFLLESLALTLALSVYGAYMSVFGRGDLTVFRGYPVYCFVLLTLPTIYEIVLGGLWVEEFGGYAPWNYVIIISLFPPVVMHMDTLLEMLFSVLILFHILVPLTARHRRLKDRDSLLYYTMPPKLVRDRIPDISPERSYKIAKEGELEELILRKIVEESLELYRKRSCDELADLLDIIEEYMMKKGIERHVIEEVRRQKRDVRGGFSKRYVLRR